MIEMNSPAWKLSGMQYRGGYYTPEEWKEKTGVNPRNYPEYFTVNRAGTVSVTDKFRRDYEIVSQENRRLMRMLTS
jgi:hypothetical protein